MLVLTAPTSQRDGLANELGRQLAERCRPVTCHHVGLAARRVEDRLTLIALAHSSYLQLQSTPMMIETGGELRLRGTTNDAVSHFEILVASPQGQVHSLTEQDGGAFDATFEPELIGPHRVEILGTIDRSPTVLALFPICVGCRRLHITPETPLGQTIDPDGAEQRLFELINQLRQSAGAEPLEPNQALAEVSVGHAVSMREAEFFAHRDLEHRGPAERLEQAGISSPRVLENIALAPTAEQAFVTLLESPAHLRSMLDEEVTHIGVGAALASDGGLRIVVTMAALPPLLAAGPATQRLLEVIERARAEAELSPLRRVSDLDDAAAAAVQVLTSLLDEGSSFETARQQATEVLLEQQVAANQALIMHIDDLDQPAPEPVLEPDTRRMGLAAEPGDDPTAGYHAVVLLSP